MSNQKADLMEIAKTIEEIKERKRLEREEQYKSEITKKQELNSTSQKKASEGNQPSDASDS